MKPLHEDSLLVLYRKTTNSESLESAFIIPYFQKLVGSYDPSRTNYHTWNITTEIDGIEIPGKDSKGKKIAPDRILGLAKLCNIDLERLTEHNYLLRNLRVDESK